MEINLNSFLLMVIAIELALIYLRLGPGEKSESEK